MFFFLKSLHPPPLWKHFFSQTLGMFERFNSLHGEKMIFRAKWIIFWGIQCKKGWKNLSVEYWSDSRPRSARWCVVPWFLKEVWGSTLGSLSDFHFVGFDFQFWFFPLRSSKNAGCSRLVWALLLYHVPAGATQKLSSGVKWKNP